MLTEEQLAALFDALGPVDRIILAGDYRQLPPIGTGRPFVDITKYVRPQSFATKSITVNSNAIDFVVYSGPGYAELTKIRRQTEKGDVRWDVLLSKCFSDNPSKGDLETFHALASGSISSKHIRLQKWYENTDFRKTFGELLKEELGLDHYEVRGWRCVHRHFYVTQLSHLFCARVRQEYDDSPGDQADRISVEQVRSAMNVWLDTADLPPSVRRERFEKELEKQQ